MTIREWCGITELSIVYADKLRFHEIGENSFGKLIPVGEFDVEDNLTGLCWVKLDLCEKMIQLKIGSVGGVWTFDVSPIDDIPLPPLLERFRQALDELGQLPDVQGLGNLLASTAGDRCFCRILYERIDFA